ncbi:MAG: UDP-N-acetylglucosamine 4,6-dehydratase (inverting) [Candidatus Komeilibacteria bacterium CG11_big_fil_rev_8_21_14_0_20_36_20]|uniref:UDP-N-acetylglucosamine 4,6-dehydratase (Inverting) n=1 Tax=Candidatus Komeilibacteria bacterium CG11_big_fil_rev_8_21_14_0_20_36_20 TaxID=1974477 RepID=A0A2H0NDK9_9BACT|nr:MAG: UDP-N-acetylglucosamine 4,6-dehydratase (inverting) [Candidatus Komeilibacteria bacterium CG11_big_fil_rev_8_21_14_0_20_36_20]PIR81351.1 MAG: UDP-N-acetylglucosamine 4,6-dehydratase (inverting) [Candidatus Komeilibacteria bacterium CG10_big_fil_rev_8_21_14_0_10_36_65]PJC54981.1 MAG: UDP-N-acetylglucosamine 4,6-dehydratase (inverting) [Candidatus Komeilibacteria bacterium CG_4_9_14_0_2_um_filter_36_13]
MLDNKTVLVTGGTGSFGKSFTKFLLDNYQLKKLIVFSRDELKQSEMKKEISDDRLRFFLGDVRDLQRLQRAFRGVDIIIHAAALKQIPTLEYNPFEAVKTNILGSQNVIDAAIDQQVKRVVLISTDKAAQPVNLYGSTKLCAEKLFSSGNSYATDKTKFSCVRYGNVIGSRGSIVEHLLKKSSLEKVYITDERMTRFWITLEQAFRLVLFTLENMQGGEIFIPKIPSMKLVDLVNALAPNVPREIIGIRPGEKLHETLVTKEETRHTVELDKYFVVLSESYNKEEHFKKFLDMGKKMESNIGFVSDTNKEWMTAKDLKKLLLK